jgi:DNA-directed RNA polymerase subunit RPC12/RpoP
MEALDGNSIGGALLEYFGREMTTATGSCRHCGAAWQIAELMVYSRAPGAVVRCPSCGSVVIVLVEVRGSTQVHLDDFALDQSEAV